MGVITFANLLKISWIIILITMTLGKTNVVLIMARCVNTVSKSMVLIDLLQSTIGKTNVWLQVVITPSSNLQKKGYYLVMRMVQQVVKLLSNVPLLDYTLSLYSLCY